MATPDAVNWAQIIGELIAEHELTTRKQIEPLVARIAVLEQRSVELEQHAEDVDRKVAEQRTTFLRYVDQEELRQRIAALEAAPANRLKVAK